MVGSDITGLLVALTIGVCLLVLVVGCWLWYGKVNEQVRLLKEIRNELRAMRLGRSEQRTPPLLPPRPR